MPNVILIGGKLTETDELDEHYLDLIERHSLLIELIMVFDENKIEFQAHLIIQYDVIVFSEYDEIHVILNDVVGDEVIIDDDEPQTLELLVQTEHDDDLALFLDMSDVMP